MTRKINSIPLSQAQPGMTLATALCDSAGNALLAEGVELTATTLASLARRGVSHLAVIEEEHLSEEQLAARRAEGVARLDFLFRQSGDDPLMAALHDTVMDYRMEMLR